MSPRSPNEKHAQVHHAFRPLQASRMTQCQGAQEEGDSPCNTFANHQHHALLTDEEENLKLEQISATHPGILDLLGEPGNLLYDEPHSMAKHFNAMMLGTCSVGQLPNWGHCKDPEALARVYEDEARQACQKILHCLDVRVLDGDLVVPTCL